MTLLKFIDKSKEENLRDGIEFYAVGLVTHDNMVDGKPRKSGKDYAVMYIDPWGELVYSWRAAGDIEVTPIDRCDYETLLRAFRSAESKEKRHE